MQALNDRLSLENCSDRREILRKCFSDHSWYIMLRGRKQPKQKFPWSFSLSACKGTIGSSKSIEKNILEQRSLRAARQSAQPMRPSQAWLAVLISLQFLFSSTDFEPPMVNLHIGNEKLLGIFCFGCIRVMYAVYNNHRNFDVFKSRFCDKKPCIFTQP